LLLSEHSRFRRDCKPFARRGQSNAKNVSSLRPVGVFGDDFDPAYIV
jgi:hypothetical protein